MRTILLVFTIFIYLTCNGQMHYIYSNQPKVVEAFAGEDTSVNSGDSVVLGESPSAKFGYGNYFYSWVPSTGLNDATLANPIAKPEMTTLYTLWVWDGMNCLASDEVQVVVKPLTRLDHELSPSVIIYPNPTKLSFHLELFGFFGQVEMKILNYLGQIVLDHTFEVNDGFNKEVDIRKLQNGYYFLLLQNEGFSITKPLVIN